MAASLICPPSRSGNSTTLISAAIPGKRLRDFRGMMPGGLIFVRHDCDGCAHDAFRAALASSGFFSVFRVYLFSHRIVEGCHQTPVGKWCLVVFLAGSPEAMVTCGGVAGAQPSVGILFALDV